MHATLSTLPMNSGLHAAARTEIGRHGQARTFASCDAIGVRVVSACVSGGPLTCSGWPLLF
eukprot:3137362-Prymnesium_polylepis.1